jgi:hypothetical protein
MTLGLKMESKLPIPSKEEIEEIKREIKESNAKEIAKRTEKN